MARRDAVGRATREETVWLRHPDHLDEWRDVLTDLITRSQADITASRALVVQARGDHAAYHQALKDHARRTAGATSFRQSLESRLRECKRLQRLRDDARQRNGINEQALRMAALEVNIASHQRSLEALAADVASLQHTLQTLAANIEDGAEVAS